MKFNSLQRIFCCIAIFIGASFSQECGEDEFLCEGSDSCVPSSYVCDGVPDCVNETDEENCPATTATECPGFTCPASGSCIPSSWICDGDNDCGDMSDEPDCPSTTSTQCSGFVCNDGECLPDFWQCDSEPDCDGGEDEAGCPCEGFECPSGRCIPSGWTCDGDNDCEDFSDETEEACPCNEGEDRCPSVQEGLPGSCLPSYFICDEEGIWDCPDGFDEANCTTSAEDSQNPSTPVVRKSRPETARANDIRRLTKDNDLKAYEQRHAQKRQSQFFKNRSAKKNKKARAKAATHA